MYYIFLSKYFPWLGRYASKYKTEARSPKLVILVEYVLYISVEIFSLAGEVCI